MLSYICNMSLTICSLAVVRHYNLGVVGSFLCLCQFQGTRLLVNAVRLVKAGNSPLKRTQPLDSWMTGDVVHAAAA